MENSIEKSSAAVGGGEVSKKTKCLDLKTLYKAKVSKEGKKNKFGEQNDRSRVGDDEKRKEKKKRKSGKEISSDRLDEPVGKKSRKSLDEGRVNEVPSGSVELDRSGGLSGLSHRNGLNSIALCVGESGNVIHIPKRPRGSVGRKKFVGDRLGKVDGSSNSVHEVGSLNSEVRKVESSGSSAAEAGSSERTVKVPTNSARKVGGSKVKKKRAANEVKEKRNSRVTSARPAKEDDGHVVLNNGDASSRKCRSIFRKSKDSVSVSGTAVVKVEPSMDNSSSVFDDFQDDDDDEENLEQNAARMLSSRFDPRCTGFSSKSRSSGRPSENGFSLSVTSDQDFVSRRADSMAGLKSESADAASRVLRPRKQHKEKGLSRKRRHFYEVVTKNLDACWFLNRRVKVFWPLDESWYHGLVNDYDPETKLHHVKYDDRDEEWINLENEKFKLLLLPSEVPGRGERKRRSSMGNKYTDKDKTDVSEDDDSYAGNYLDSEPIISWLARSSRRLKSSPSSSSKKQKTIQLSPSLVPHFPPVKNYETRGDVGPLVEDEGKSDSACALPDSSTDCERLENSLLGSPSSSKASNCLVYVRKRKKREGLSPVFENEKANSPVGTYITSAPIVDNMQTWKECEDLLWLIDDHGLLRLRMQLLESKRLRFVVCLPVLPFLVYSFKANQYWLYRALLLPHYGTIMTTWPEVVLEILFVDNTVGLRFLLFEGCLKQAITLFALILTAFNQSPGERKFFEMQLPITSIRFKLSCIQDLRKQQVFAFYSFSKLKHSKWLYLNSKLQRHCLLTKQLPLSDCTYDNLKSFEGGSCQLHKPRVAAVTSQFKKRYVRSFLPVGVAREYGSIRMSQSAFNSAIKFEKLPAFALSFTAAPTFFLSLHLKLLMERNFACISCPDNSQGSSEDSEVPSNAVPVYGTEVDSHLEKVVHTIPQCDVGTSFAKTASESYSFAEQHSTTSLGLVAGCDEGILAAQGPDSGKLDIAATSPGSKNFENNAIGKNMQPQKCVSDDQQLDQIDAAPAHPVSKTAVPSGLGNTESYSCLGGLSVELPCFDENDKSLDGGANSSRQASYLVGNAINVQSPYPTGNRSSWHHDRNGSSSSPIGDLSPAWPDGRSTFMRSGFGNGPKRPRTQVQYSLPPGRYDFISKHKSQNQRALPYKRIRRSNEKRMSDGLRGSQKNLEMLACDTNVLVTLGDKGWRECGARVVLELTDHSEWRLAVKVSGVTKYSLKVNHILQPGSTNRYTHAMMWKGGKDWVLEFPDRSQWILFKEMYEECYNRNIRAALVKNIPIPGVCLIEESDDYATDVLFVRNSPKYLRQVESDVEMALDPSRILYDMDSEDEQWILKTEKSLCIDENKGGEISDELFEKIMDILEKVSYSQQRDHFTVDELEELMVGIDSVKLIEAIYEHWRQKRQRKGLPLIRHLEPPLWERYQQQLKEWEEAVARGNSGSSSGCKEKTMSIEKPPMFAFCLRPRGLEVPNKGSKQRSQKRFPVSGHYQSVSADHEGLHTFGRRSNGFTDEKVVLLGKSHEFSDTSPSFQPSTRVFSPRDGGAISSFSLSGDVSDWNHYPKFQRNKLKKHGAFPSPSNSQFFASYNQRTPGMRNGVQRWNMDIPEWPSQKNYHYEGSQRYGIEQLDGSDLHEFRLRDASNAAQHALNMAKLKREKAQRLLYRADLAIHKAVVALMNAEAIKASFDSSNCDG